MKALFLLLLLSSPTLADWIDSSPLDRDLTRLVASDTHLLAYSENKISTSTNGNLWSSATNPGFPILNISKGASGGFIALSYEKDPLTLNIELPYLVTIMDSADGMNWTRRTQIARAFGFTIPISGAIADAKDYFVFTVTMGELQHGQTFTLTGDNSKINEIHLNVDQLVNVDGTIFGEYYNRENINSDTCLTTGFNDYVPNRPWASWRRTSIYLDLKTAVGDLMIGQNGLYRQGGEIYYGNWKDLGEIQGYHNGVGLILPKESSPGKILISHDFLQSWTEQDLSGRLIDAVFFKDHWHVLSDLGAFTKTYSLATSPQSLTILEDAQLNTRTVSDLNFSIPGCNETATTGLEIILPGSSDQLFQIHTSRNLEDWTAYGLPMPGGKSHLFPIPSEATEHPPTFFRANEIEIHTDD